jgi:transposase
MDGPTLGAWTEQMPAPQLEPGDIVSMDNLAAHKVQGVRQAIEAKGAQLRYLPPYSPDLNPIENAFAKLKALLRKAAERTIEAYGERSASCSTASRLPNAETISKTQAMYGQRENALDVWSRRVMV